MFTLPSHWHFHCTQTYCSEGIPDVSGSLFECFAELEKHEIYPNGEIKPGLLEQKIELTHVDNSGAHACRWLVTRLNLAPTEADAVSLLAQTTILAQAKNNGNLVIVRSKTGWKVLLGIPPTLDTGEEASCPTSYATLEMALQASLMGL